MDYEPVYIQSIKNKKLDEIIDKLYSMLESCVLCPRKCKVNRLKGEKGYCNSGEKLQISSYSPHFGEEEPLIGSRSLSFKSVFEVSRGGGSGTIFLTNCNLLCVFCQNYDISHLGHGDFVTKDEAAEMMLYLQNTGCFNINFVSPTHFAPQLVAALKIAAKGGLKLPVVWNCGGYEDIEVIKLLDGIIDIYMPDFKFASRKAGEKYCNAPDYFERCKESVKEMHRQVGDLKLDKNGIAYQGLLVRHLVMPEDVAESEKILKFLAEEISKDTYINIMSQYHPAGEAHKYHELTRRPFSTEFDEVIRTADKLSLSRGFQKKHLKRFK